MLYVIFHYKKLLSIFANEYYDAQIRKAGAISVQQPFEGIQGELRTVLKGVKGK
jgi:hypothetical protein